MVGVRIQSEETKYFTFSDLYPRSLWYAIFWVFPHSEAVQQSGNEESKHWLCERITPFIRMLLLKGGDYCFLANVPINTLIIFQRKWEAMPTNTQSKELLPLNYFEHLTHYLDCQKFVRKMWAHRWSHFCHPIYDTKPCWKCEENPGSHLGSTS